MLNFPIPSFTLCQKNAISPKVFNRFSKTFLLLQDVENRYFGWKFHGRSCFSLAMARRKLLHKGNVKFSNSKLYTLSDKMLYHQSYSTDFQKLSFCWKMWKIGICVENFMSAAILVLQWQRENRVEVEEFEISHFQAVHCIRKNAISLKVFNRFSKTFFLLKDVDNRYLARKFHGRSYFSLAMAMWNPLQKGNVKFPKSKLYTVSDKMLYHQSYSADFQNLSFGWKMWIIGIWQENFMGAAILVLQWQCEIHYKKEMLNFPIPSFTLCQIKCYITKAIQPIFKNFPSAGRCGK